MRITAEFDPVIEFVEASHTTMKMTPLMLDFIRFGQSIVHVANVTWSRGIEYYTIIQIQDVSFCKIWNISQSISSVDGDPRHHWWCLVVDPE